MDFDHMAPHSRDLVSVSGIGVNDYATTIVQRICISAFEGASERCRVQEKAVCAALPRDACSCLRHVQHSAASAEPPSNARASRTLGISLEQGGRVTAAGSSKAQKNLVQLN